MSKIRISRQKQQDKVNIPTQNLELFKMRYGIEAKLNDAMDLIGYNGKNHISLVQSAYYLSRQGVLDPKCTDLLIQVVRIANRGVHGEIVDQKYLDFASEAYPKIIDALDDCKWTDQEDDLTCYLSSKGAILTSNHT